MILHTWLFFLATVHALSVHVPRIVSPTILQPTSQTAWTVGQVETVAWYVVTQALDLAGQNGTILLGYLNSDGSDFLWRDQPLATNVTLEDGRVNVRCPFNLPGGQRYVVALLGDENNLSGVFQILDANFSAISTTSVFPSTLSTSGDVPSATITRTSVVGTIPASPTSSSSGSSSSDASSSTASATTTRNSGGSSTRGFGLGIVLAAAIGIIFASSVLGL
ncbi:hypothetical protein LXA43DRAFT_1112634 [Ganoderma leucocontextum]|nr:hypothetical protein LXA43DRAFT_1112634 [Ganoderma leucocontextum]